MYYKTDGKRGTERKKGEKPKRYERRPFKKVRGNNLYIQTDKFNDRITNALSPLKPGRELSKEERTMKRETNNIKRKMSTRGKEQTEEYFIFLPFPPAPVIKEKKKRRGK